MSQARLAWDQAPRWAKNAKKDSLRSPIFFPFSSSAEPGPWISEANVFCAKRGEEKNNDSHSFRALRKMPRSPRLAHKAPVTQAMDDHARVNLQRTQRVLRILAL